MILPTRTSLLFVLAASLSGLACSAPAEEEAAEQGQTEDALISKDELPSATEIDADLQPNEAHEPFAYEAGGAIKKLVIHGAPGEDVSLVLRAQGGGFDASLRVMAPEYQRVVLRAKSRDAQAERRVRFAMPNEGAVTLYIRGYDKAASVLSVLRTDR